MSDTMVKKNLKYVEGACQVDEELGKLRKYLIGLATGEIKDNMALFADGAFERALKIAETEQKIGNKLENEPQLEPPSEQEGFEPGE